MKIEEIKWDIAGLKRAKDLREKLQIKLTELQEIEGPSCGCYPEGFVTSFIDILKELDAAKQAEWNKQMVCTRKYAAFVQFHKTEYGVIEILQGFINLYEQIDK